MTCGCFVRSNNGIGPEQAFFARTLASAGSIDTAATWAMKCTTKAIPVSYTQQGVKELTFAV